MAFQAKELSNEDIEKIRASQDGINKLAEAFGIAAKRIEGIRKAESLEKALVYAKGMPKEDKKVTPTQPAPVKTGGEIAAVLQPAKGAVIFTLNEKKIALNPVNLINAHAYYEDTIEKNDIDQDFSSFIEDAVRHCWRDMNLVRASQGGVSLETEAQNG